MACKHARINATRGRQLGTPCSQHRRHKLACHLMHAKRAALSCVGLRSSEVDLAVHWGWVWLNYKWLAMTGSS